MNMKELRDPPIITAVWNRRVIIMRNLNLVIELLFSLFCIPGSMQWSNFVFRWNNVSTLMFVGHQILDLGKVALASRHNQSFSDEVHCATTVVKS